MIRVSRNLAHGVWGKRLALAKPGKGVDQKSGRVSYRDGCLTIDDRVQEG